MSGINLQYNIDLAVFDQALAVIAGQPDRDLRNEIGEILVSDIQERFQDGKSPTGVEWPVSQRAADEGGKTLVDRGHLRDSITYNAADPDFVEVGSNLVYAAIHQFGGKAGRGRKVRLPARPYLGVSRDAEHEIGAATVEHVRGLLQ